MMEKGFSRVGRALMFIKHGREARNLAYKITNYCSALETIFTTDSAELSHKLAERVAFFLQDEKQKIDVFNLVKSAYSIRSKLTHGDTLKPTQIDKIPNISIQTDELLRIVINKILNDSILLKVIDGTNQEIDDYFNGLIFK